MTGEQFRILQQSQPFRPFVIHLADGRSFEVGHPDLALLDGRRRTVAILNADREHEVLDMLLITSLRPLKEAHRKAKR